MVLGEEESVLFREVSLFQGCPYRGVPLYIHMYRKTIQDGKPTIPGEPLFWLKPHVKLLEVGVS